ncbi:hypothetical protein KB20921_20010 [Edwardsiella ictaluri]|uniref:Uncharacterized protein n=1 Tax=Edwardsiella ictaluri (strain 93-146) TaxID=634503 RepID=C5BFW8_EDWI9|nr:hypothetical protein NT01EI_2221 [Edwardsiella ictaluri 93-146]BEH99249.1 hypothetical protein KH20906_19770 [Edwardsiella ictaluri]BEI02740.1 hypothetical protein KB20921_20010 [Edwardsiella ictaluri]BEI06205.1 hypothetical protein KH201010_19910 [Edwardsiella ictaluri]BEI09664.1 hypothetical protein STU22726_19950 [Edwardsiella ictaluri]
MLKKYLSTILYDYLQWEFTETVKYKFKLTGYFSTMNQYLNQMKINIMDSLRLLVIM